MSRPNFIALCERLTVEDEKAFEALWRQLGLSVDWSMTYATISRASQRVSQLAFLNLLRKDRAYQLEAPTLWDVDFRTAVAQAELEDREQPGAYHKLQFARSERRSGGTIEIETTRPELLPACVALVAHPDDERYQPLFGSRGADAALQRAGADPGAPAGQPRQGHRRRHDLHLRRSHRRHLVARAEPAGARDPAGERHAAAGGVGQRRAGSRRDAARRRGAYDQLVVALGRPRRGRRSSSCCARRAICSASRDRSRTR